MSSLGTASAKGAPLATVAVMVTITEPVLASRLRAASAGDAELCFRVLDHGDGGSFADSEEGEHGDPVLLPSGRSAYDVLGLRQWAPALSRLCEEISSAGLLLSSAGTESTDEFLLDLTTGEVRRASTSS